MGISALFLFFTTAIEKKNLQLALFFSFPFHVLILSLKTF